jgi:competence protein ComEA
MVARLMKMGAAAIVLVAIVVAAGGVAPAATSSTVKEKPELVDINSATAADLEKVPGLGPSLSRRIVEFRDKNGPYSTVEDLLKIQGIGEKSLSRFRDYLTANKPQKK